MLLTGCGIEQVDEGYRGVKQVWGRVEGDPLAPGLYFYNPISSGIRELDVRERKSSAATDCFTRDTQQVKLTYAVTYYPKQEQIGKLYSQFGNGWEATIVEQAVLGSIKDVVGQYIADDLVSKRETAKAAAEKELKDSLLARGVVVTRLDFVNLDFDDAYERAVEAKVVAVQRASEAKNKTVQVEEEAKQRVSAAEADARAMQIKSEALSKNKGLVEYEAIQKWDGKLPVNMFGNSTPIINLNALGRPQ
jgi:prohibitin 2